MPVKLSSIDRVLIRVPNWVGDLVMALPALRELRRLFAKSHITLAVRPWVAGLLEGEELADDAFLLPVSSGHLNSAVQFMKIARQLNGMFDLAVLLQNAFGAALLAKAARIKTIAGYPTDARRSLLDLVIPFQPDY